MYVPSLLELSHFWMLSVQTQVLFWVFFYHSEHFLFVFVQRLGFASQYIND